MKEKTKVSLVQFSPEWLEREKNAERMKQFAEQEAEEGSELIVYPELVNIGYITPLTIGLPPSFDEKTSAVEFHAKYIEASEPIPGPTTELLGKVASKYGIYIVAGLSELHPVIPFQLYNSAALIGPLGVIGVHRKAHLPSNERYYFHPGSSAEVYRTDLGNISISICYDARFPEFIRVFGLKGSEIHCALWASPAGVGIDPLGIKYRAHVRALENAFYFLSCNRVGTEGNVSFIGHSAMADPDGNFIALSESDREEVLTAELSNEALLEARAKRTQFRDRRPDLYSLVTEPLSPIRDPIGYGMPSFEYNAGGQLPDRSAQSTPNNATH